MVKSGVAGDEKARVHDKDLKKGLLDPQGRAVREMLQDHGFKVGEVVVGKVVEMEVDDSQDVKRSWRSS
ncbi:MAG: phosphoribosylformylglycinamidine synthase subunit PurS [Aquificota bacterium]|nr:phosphoribosylformylglycinamidine synthase subunit PurS [Aquificota bacterium]